MANTLPVRMTATIIDELGVEADCTVYALVDPTATIGYVLSTWSILLSSIDGVTAGRIVRSQFCALPALPALKGVPADGSRVQQTGLLTVTGTATTRRDSVAVPALSNTLIADGAIVTATGPVASLIRLLQTGGASLEPTTSDWDGPLTFKDSLITFREYNQQLEPASFTLA